MDSRLTILDELSQISPWWLVSALGTLTRFLKAILSLLPIGMFQLKAQRLDPKQELEGLSTLLSGISKQVPYEVPKNYFVDLSDQVVVGAKAIEFVNEELENLSPLMYSLKEKNVYEVPEGYFESLAQNILVEAKKQQPAKLIALRPMRKIMRFAVAAVLVGVMAIGGWFNLKPPTNNDAVAKIEHGIQKASDEEIMNFIQNDELPSGETALNTDGEMDETDITRDIANVSDSELEQFANESIDQNNTLSN
jgi:hypothetical protein